MTAQDWTRGSEKRGSGTPTHARRGGSCGAAASAPSQARAPEAPGPARLFTPASSRRSGLARRRLPAREGQQRVCKPPLPDGTRSPRVAPPATPAPDASDRCWRRPGAPSLPSCGVEAGTAEGRHRLPLEGTLGRPTPEGPEETGQARGGPEGETGGSSPASAACRFLFREATRRYLPGVGGTLTLRPPPPPQGAQAGGPGADAAAPSREGTRAGPAGPERPALGPSRKP